MSEVSSYIIEFFKYLPSIQKHKSVAKFQIPNPEKNFTLYVENILAYNTAPFSNKGRNYAALYEVHKNNNYVKHKFDYVFPNSTMADYEGMFIDCPPQGTNFRHTITEYRRLADQGYIIDYDQKKGISI
jgi:hypothetical protein